MRILSRSTLKKFYKEYSTAEQSLLAWADETENAMWETPQQLKEQYKSASILGDKRVVFNIKGNDFRLIVDIEYKFSLVFVIWIDTHQEYDNINAKTIEYVKNN